MVWRGGGGADAVVMGVGVEGGCMLVLLLLLLGGLVSAVVVVIVVRFGDCGGGGREGRVRRKKGGGGVGVGKGDEGGVGRWEQRSRRGRLASVAVRLGVSALSRKGTGPGPIGREK